MLQSFTKDYWGDQIKVDEMGKMRHAKIILIGTPEEKSLLGRPKHRWEDGHTIKIYLQEIAW
jgi:hypothetical protein